MYEIVAAIDVAEENVQIEKYKNPKISMDELQEFKFKLMNAM